jgi:hypothetical protein
MSLPQSTQSDGPVRFLIFCSISVSLLASLVAGRRPSVMLVQISMECTPPFLSTGISNLLQPAQPEVMLGQLSTYLTSWVPALTTKPLAWYAPLPFFVFIAQEYSYMTLSLPSIPRAPTALLKSLNISQCHHPNSWRTDVCILTLGNTWCNQFSKEYKVFGRK